MAACFREGITVSDEKLSEFLAAAKDFALLYGISMNPDAMPESANKVQCAPFTLFPSIIPKTKFYQAVDSMLHFNRLMHRVAHDHEFLENSLRNVIKVDDFTKRLWDIYITVRKEGFAQPISLGLFRNDFMLDCQHDCSLRVKQIEFNTIAASFGGMVTSTTLLHRFMLDLIGQDYDKSEIPDNEPALGLAKGMVRAWELYDNPQAVILFVINPAEVNVIDQRWLEFKAHDVNCHAHVIRRSFSDICAKGTLTADKKLIIDDYEIAVVYFRSGYQPASFPTEKEWEARLKIEQSRAIKCPSIHYHLAGTKKIQQVLAKPGSVERFFDDQTVVDKIRATFVEQHSLDMGSEGDKAIELALTSPQKFVVKPQREGGGNNFYGDDIPKFLKENRESPERNAYILMERIFPMPQKNYLIKSGVPFIPLDVISELGIYGVYIGTKDEEKMNTQCGHMLRTKVLGTDEGGICAGFAGLDTPFIQDDDLAVIYCSVLKK